LPIISFYSYKGGVGRTTALAAFAAFYASIYEKKVVMIDCDFEAPGFANYFELDQVPPTNGVLEFLLDSQFAGDEVKLKPYVIQVSNKYSGNGEIYTILAGNLSREIAFPDAPKYGSHFKQYLEGISRLNISGEDQMFAHLSDLLDEVHKEIKPDLILIDTRNGINDIFGNIGLPFSSIMVGVFKNEFQSMPGLHFF
jgi:MinD-like ATPase involved in chromosome partitioning or flagellar assembly